MMSENNVTFRLERYDEICAIAFNRHGSPSPTAPLKLLYRIVVQGCGGSSSASKAR
jgi:hypothetical protein